MIQPLATLVGAVDYHERRKRHRRGDRNRSWLGVVEASSIGIGGDAFCLFYSAKEKKLGAGRSGRSPYAASLDFCRKSAFKEMPQRGIHSVTVPGAVHGWATLLNSYGKKKLGDVLQAAIRHAEEGFPVAELTAEQWKESEARLKADEGAAINYLIDGRTPKAGEVFRNPRMAATLKQIAAEGVDYFYKGEIAKKIVRCSEKLGGRFAVKDFADHCSDWWTHQRQLSWL